MTEQYVEDEQVLRRFACNLDESLFESLEESFLDEPVLLYGDDGSVDMATALTSDYFQRAAFGEFAEAEQYLAELCIHIEDDDLRNRLIDEFELDREYIESEL